jgi:hypothetical protein
MPTDLQNLTLIFDGETEVSQTLNLSHIPPLRFLLLKQ